METKKTRFSTSRKRANEDRAAVDAAVDTLVSREPDTIPDEDLELLSDLSRPAAQRLAERWLELPYNARLTLVQRMVAMFETHIDHHFDQALVVALADPNDDVKLVAFGGLTETTTPSLLEYLLDTLPQESNPDVRAAGARIFGQFALQSEYQSLDKRTSDILREVLLTLADNDDSETVRLRALESAGYLAGDIDVIEAIEDAWGSGRHEAQVSALRAMGHQGDPRWIDIVLGQLASEEPEIRFEAVRATGTLAGQQVALKIIDLTDDDDAEVQLAAIASLGMIGGDIAVRALRGLEQSESVAVSDAAGAALDEALMLDNAARPPNSLWQT